MFQQILDIGSYAFNPFALLSLGTGSLSILLGAATLIRERGSKTAWSFCGLCLTVWFWLATFSLMYLATDLAVAYWWTKVSYLGVPLIAPATYDFATRVLDIRARRRWLVESSWALFAGFVFTFAATDIFFGSLHVYAWGFYPALNPVALAFVAPFVGLIGLSLWEFWRSHRDAETETERLRARAFLVGFGTAALALLDYLPGFGINVYPIGFLPVLAFLAIAAMAIWRYRLADLTPAFIAERLVRTMPDMLLVCDAKERIHLGNPALSRVLQYEIESLQGRPLHTLADDDESRDTIHGLLREPVTFDRQLKLRARDGGSVEVSVSASELRDDRDQRVGSMIIARDIRERKRLQRELVRRALFDHLTGLPNRALLLNRTDGALAQGRRRGTQFALACLDIDDLDGVAASLGLEAADGLLTAVARRLAAAVRESDTVARLEGAEFGLLLRNASTPEDAVRAVGRIQEALSAPFELEGQRVFVGASFGIAVTHAGYGEAAELLRDARTALHRARERGRRQVEVFDRDLRSQVSQRLALESELRGALAEEEFRLLYQPIVSLEDGRVRAWEALLRWQHPEHGLLGPDRFLETAERTGLVVHIGAWTLRTACRQLRNWSEGGDDGSLQPAVHVNLSAREFAQAELADTIRKVLEETGTPGERLVLELTETTLMERAEHALRTMKILRALGVRFAIDDFGTGYSSLAYLHRFPVDIVKIDRSFVSGEGGRGDLEISRAIVNLGHGMGLEVIAEGIETEEQVRLLRNLGCRYGQGYHLASPAEPAGARAPRPANRERVRHDP